MNILFLVSVAFIFIFFNRVHRNKFTYIVYLVRLTRKAMTGTMDTTHDLESGQALPRRPSSHSIMPAQQGSPINSIAATTAKGVTGTQKATAKGSASIDEVIGEDGSVEQKKKLPCCCGYLSKKWCIILAVGNVIFAGVVVAILLTVALTPITQVMIDGTTVQIEQLTMTAPQNDQFNMTAKMTVHSGAFIGATAGPAVMNVIYKEQVIGNVTLPQVCQGKKFWVRGDS